MADGPDWSIIYKASIGSLVAVCAWLCSTTIAHSSALATLQAQAITTRDALPMHKQLSEMQTTIIELQRRIQLLEDWSRRHGYERRSIGPMQQDGGD